jgi:hypothetical protein
VTGTRARVLGGGLGAISESTVACRVYPACSGRRSRRGHRPMPFSRWQRLQISIDRAQVVVRHPDEVLPGHGRPDAAATVHPKACDEVLLAEPVQDPVWCQVGRDERAGPVRHREAAAKRRTDERPRQPAPARVAAMAVRDRVGQVAPVHGASGSRQMRRRGRGRAHGPSTICRVNVPSQVNSLSGARCATGGSVRRKERMACRSSSVTSANDMKRRERPPVPRNAVAQAPHQRGVADGSDADHRIARDVRRHDGAEQAEVERPAA